MSNKLTLLETNAKNLETKNIPLIKAFLSLLITKGALFQGLSWILHTHRQIQSHLSPIEPKIFQSIMSFIDAFSW